MPRLQQKKKTKLGRNDPCWCGSGKKYKDCHFPIEQTQRAETMKLCQTQDALFNRILEAVELIPEQFPLALEQFWKGKYTIEQMAELDDLEQRGAERFLTWVAFDYLGDQEHTLVERLAASVESMMDTTDTSTADASVLVVDPFEQRLLQHWQHVRLQPYVIEAINEGQGLTVRNMLTAQIHEVADAAAANRMEMGEIMVAHLVPAGGKAMITPAEGIEPAYGRNISDEPTYYLAGAAAHITSDTSEQLLEFASLYLEDLRRTQPAATWHDFARQRSYVLNHFIMALPEAAPDPSIVQKIVMRTRVALQLTGASLSNLIGRDQPADADAALADEAEPDAPADPDRGADPDPDTLALNTELPK